jgi:7-cyano-7-deazaguanine synthase
MDSTVTAYVAAETHDVRTAVSVNYGQRHAKELEYAKATAQALGANHHVIDLTQITKLLAVGSDSLTNRDTPVPDGHYTEETMRATVVPNRNMMMLSIAGAIAAANGDEVLFVGVHGGDHFIYPDCRPEFVTSFATTLRLGTMGHSASLFRVEAPFVYRDKTAICQEGHRLGLDFNTTWSCYKGGDIHCGSCGTCCERIEAFLLAGVPDPTQYVNAAASHKILRDRGVTW